MKKLVLALLSVSALLGACKQTDITPAGGKSAYQNNAITAIDGTIRVFDQILFYDGYAATVSDPVPEGVTRVSNSKYVKKLSPAQLAGLGNVLQMKVTIKAACDNYDRIAYVAIAMVKKNTAYTDATAKHIEIGRFITPFMNKNKQPDQVPYLFSIDNVAAILKDPTLNANFDIYLEFSIFGVPYAANKEIAGCAGRNDTFFGTVDLISNTSGTTATNPAVILEPLSFNQNINNYDNTDVAGKTVKSITVNLAAAVKSAKLYLITSNHGANSGGEEYNRRNHFIYFDNIQKLTYKPGGKSCEPYRAVNTQGNGIYGSKPQTDAQWASFSNWCPGDAIPIRVITLGDLTAGDHTFKIEVPDAVFKDKQGYIPLSVYLQAEK
ncbi:peptide-N-glycosidase F-related protein [Pedobacter sp. UYP1]|uniref:peptide-N-glycosidase F-related protein n=1 Tax=Pedobacter sp. UYP1 TaxID=1756396 RepID=UPI0033936311